MLIDDIVYNTVNFHRTKEGKKQRIYMYIIEIIARIADF